MGDGEIERLDVQTREKGTEGVACRRGCSAVILGLVGDVSKLIPGCWHEG
jgi:hypothetical protein